jgi:ATP synthase I chain
MSGNPFLKFTDADLTATLRRALRTIAILGVLLFLILTVTAGWQTGMLMLAGALVSATGVYEWQRLISVVNARLDNQQNPSSTASVVIMFFLRMGLAAAVLYGSLKCFHGSIYALVGGLGLAVLALSVEAVRFMRS